MLNDPSCIINLCQKKLCVWIGKKKLLESQRKIVYTGIFGLQVLAR